MRMMFSIGVEGKWAVLPSECIHYAALAAADRHLPALYTAQRGAWPTRIADSSEHFLDHQLHLRV